MKYIHEKPVMFQEILFVCRVTLSGSLLCLPGVLKSFLDLRRAIRQTTWTPAAPASPLLTPHPSSDKAAVRGATCLTSMCVDPQKEKKKQTWTVCVCSAVQ